MYGQIFGRFLVQNNYLTETQLDEIIEKQKTQRPRIGMIAVTEKYLTDEEAERVNRKQQQEDKRFGDIAIEYQYLSEKQVEHLLKQQGSPYHSFFQIAILDHFLTEERYKEAENAFCKEKQFSSSDFEDIKSGEIDRILPHYVGSGNQLSVKLAGVALRAFIRLIYQDAVLEDTYETDQLQFSTLAVQNLVGDHNIFVGLAAEEDAALLSAASVFGREAFQSMEEDACDSACEFLNCINGMFASAMSADGVTLDMLPPNSYQCGTAGCERKLFVLPILFEKNRILVVIGVDKEVTIDAE